MTEQKSQLVSTIMDSELPSDAELEQLIKDQEVRSIWSRFHLVRDLIQGEAPEVIDPQLDKRIFAAILREPALLVPSVRRKIESPTSEKPAQRPSWVRRWTEEASGFAIAASVTAIMVFGVQTLNSPVTPEASQSAITALEFLELDQLQIDNQTDYTRLQEELLDRTRQRSLYGLQNMTPFVSVVNHSVTVPLTLIKSNFDTILDDIEEVEEQAKDSEENKEPNSDQ